MTTPREMVDLAFAGCRDEECADETRRYRCIYHQGAVDALDEYEDTARQGAVERVLAAWHEMSLRPNSMWRRADAVLAVDAILGPAT